MTEPDPESIVFVIGNDKIRTMHEIALFMKSEGCEVHGEWPEIPIGDPTAFRYTKQGALTDDLTADGFGCFPKGTLYDAYGMISHAWIVGKPGAGPNLWRILDPRLDPRIVY
jgi:hypothetical protein